MKFFPPKTLVECQMRLIYFKAGKISDSIRLYAKLTESFRHTSHITYREGKNVDTHGKLTSPIADCFRSILYRRINN